MWWLAVGAGGGQKNRPTSRGDSLGEVVGSWREGGGVKPPNEPP